MWGVQVRTGGVAVQVRTGGVAVQVRTGGVGCAGEDWWCGVCR